MTMRVEPPMASPVPLGCVEEWADRFWRATAKPANIAAIMRTLIPTAEVSHLRFRLMDPAGHAP